MRDQGVKKTPGSSSITIDGVVHEFMAGDETHPQAKEIFQRWEKLLEEMRLKGYEPNTSVVLLDMEENEKEKVLNRHSENYFISLHIDLCGGINDNENDIQQNPKVLIFVITDALYLSVDGVGYEEH
ncbi:putative pentatricopeptide repeat-containing protein [Camellia lanceoleosa]|uniref:Pentatricopeptide repeat-containing protein n=1 Tax=Camellia lanceoleosa TaxID=1840588 RepID=A0ACC0H4Y3_9ERIC|nr:putative pentatricopeptide repeat-containing protein [Camellia lanceoleosa]